MAVTFSDAYETLRRRRVEMSVRKLMMCIAAVAILLSMLVWLFDGIGTVDFSRLNNHERVVFPCAAYVWVGRDIVVAGEGEQVIAIPPDATRLLIEAGTEAVVVWDRDWVDTDNLKTNSSMLTCVNIMSSARGSLRAWVQRRAIRKL